MKSRDLFSVSLRNLWRRKLRTSLTILGVIIGTTAIVLMISLGIAVNQNFIEQVSSMGSLNTITVYRSWMMQEGQTEEPPIIDDKAIASFEALDGATVVSPILETYVKAVSGKYISWLNIRGVNPEILKIQNLNIAEGRMIEEGDQMSFLFGGGMKYNFYNPSAYGWNAEGSPIDFMNDKIKMSYDMSYGEKPYPGMPVPTKKVKPITITVVGVLAEGQAENDYYAYTTLEQAKKIKKEKDKYDASLNPGGGTGGQKVEDTGYASALVYVKSMKKVSDVQKAIKDMGYEANSLMEYLDTLQQTSKMMQMVLGGIGAVSLLVAAIGITNTMIMSIYERTKEIGVMKVIGASLKDIKKLFLSEAAMIGFLGGCLGLLISFLGSKLLNYLGSNVSLFGGMMTPGSKLSIIPWWLYLSAVGFTTIVGLVSGYLPAVKAMKLSVLQALRTE